MQKSALGCLSAKAVRLRGQARRRGPGRQSILGPRAQGSLASAKPSKPRPSRQGPGRSSVGGGHPRERGESGFTLKSDPVPRELLEWEVTLRHRTEVPWLGAQPATRPFQDLYQTSGGLRKTDPFRGKT
ncbi:hypothetical protein NDU88_003540 [Pleurodeles waltl]|uniref:Uncharacterized protein n=1 Tax=Pleurodeles waltl TaxID=8319 RepID=A0AAV7SEQ5_PLEWA|nr:hypothetical protein NDU88_003540 [Pleurodeles waltl]